MTGGLCCVCLEYADCKRCLCKGGWYCSIDCQKWHWRYAPEPHRDCCPLYVFYRTLKKKKIPKDVQILIDRFLGRLFSGRTLGYHRSEMLPGDVARKPATRALPPLIPRPLCCRINYTEEQQESGNDVEHKQANTGLLIMVRWRSRIESEEKFFSTYWGRPFVDFGHMTLCMCHERLGI